MRHLQRAFQLQHLEEGDALLPDPPNCTVALSTCVAARASLQHERTNDTGIKRARHKRELGQDVKTIAKGMN